MFRMFRGFYRRRLQATCDWGNTHASYNFSYKCGCYTDHIFIDNNKDTPGGRFESDRRDRMVRVFPCIKHTGKFFRTRW